MLYSPRSIVDFPEHVLSFLVESLGFNRSIRSRLNPQSIESSSYLTIPSSPNIQTDLLPIEERIVSQSSQKFIDRLQQPQDCMMKVAEIVSKSEAHYLEGKYWRFHQPIELDRFCSRGATPTIDRVFIDPNHPMITHANYLFEPDLLTISIDRGHFQGDDSTKASLCEGDRYLLDFIHPHLVQAYQNSIALTNIQQQLAESSRSKTPLFSVEAIQSLGLTKRESEVLCAIAQDKSNSDIAIALECSLSTVKKHLEHIYEKLAVQTRTAAVMTALVRLGSIEN
jgi:DNA-binding CsgD family transcriptional regulator